MLEWTVSVESAVVLAGERVKLKSTLRNLLQPVIQTPNQSDFGKAAKDQSNTTSAIDEQKNSQELSVYGSRTAEKIHMPSCITESSFLPDNTGKEELIPSITIHEFGESKQDVMGKSENPSGAECIACAIIQLVCQAVGNPSRVNMHNSRLPRASYSFSPEAGKGTIVSASIPQILFCDLRLLPGELRSDEVMLDIPHTAPPSYKGESVIYLHKVVGGLQRLGQPTLYSNMPIKVLSVPGEIQMNYTQKRHEEEQSINNVYVNLNEECSVKQSGGFLPYGLNSPFLPRLAATDFRDEVTRIVSTLTRSRSLCEFCLRNSRSELIATIALPKLSFRIGETIDLTMSFEESDVQVVKSDLRLVVREIVKDTHRAANATDDVSTSFVTHASATLYTAGALVETVLLPIPLISHPNFETEAVVVSWILEIDLVYIPSKPISKEALDHVAWRHPVHVYPTNPINIPYKPTQLFLRS